MKLILILVIAWVIPLALVSAIPIIRQWFCNKYNQGEDVTKDRSNKDKDMDIIHTAFDKHDLKMLRELENSITAGKELLDWVIELRKTLEEAYEVQHGKEIGDYQNETCAGK